MSIRIEGAGAENIIPSILSAGEQFGEDVVPEGEFAVCLNYDEVFVIQGTKDEIVHLFADALAKLATAAVKAERRVGTPTP